MQNSSFGHEFSFQRFLKYTFFSEYSLHRQCILPIYAPSFTVFISISTAKKNVQKQVCAPVYNDRKIELNKVPDFIQNNKPICLLMQ